MVSDALFQLIKSELVRQHYYKWNGSWTFHLNILKRTIPTLTKINGSPGFHYKNFVERRYGSQKIFIRGTVPTIKLNPRYGLIQITIFLRNFYQCSYSLKNERLLFFNSNI